MSLNGLDLRPSRRGPGRARPGIPEPMTNPVLEALSLLTPYDIDIPKRRIGPNGDGGYVLADRLSPSQTVMSYGIGTEYRFDEAMAEAGHTVYMFDHTIAPPVLTRPNMVWFEEGVAGTSEPARKLHSLQDQIDRLGVEGDRLILKMDVEGAEFDAIGMMPDRTLCRFEQILVEVHYLAYLENEALRAGIVAMLRKLNRFFTLFHVHANNCDGSNGLSIVQGVPVSNLLELSYIRTSAVTRTASTTLYPTPLDYPNLHPRDKLLWFFPFLPTTLHLADFQRCEARVAAQSRDEAPRSGPNIALNKPATQSSLSAYSAPDDATGAVNGRITGSFGFHTDKEDRPWWQVDLLRPTPLDEIVVFNRIDACAARAYDFVLKLGDEAGDFRQVHAQAGRPFGGRDGTPARIPLAGTPARFVRIELTSNDHLHLDEVEVYAAANRNDVAAHPAPKARRARRPARPGA